jgi:predicted metal-dependent enzyme (double-stranded beta helix superfamily)
MDEPPEKLSLDDFIVEMSLEPASRLPHARFMDLASRLRLSDELIAGRTRFSAETYARNLVCRTPFFELLVLCWRPGQQTTIHDHAGALNAIRVHCGVLTSRVFTATHGTGVGAGPVRQVAEQHVLPDDPLVGVDRDGIHQLVNASLDDLVTVHVYAPALMTVTVYSTEAAEVQRQPLRYTVEQDLD